MDFDVLIVGAGVSGCAIARELARYRVRVAILERGASLASGATRANSAIVHAGYDCVPGTLMARLNVLGNRMMGPLCEALSVPFRQTGSLVLAFDRKQEEHLLRLREQGEQSGVPGLQILDRREALERESALNPAVTAALWAPTAGIVCPYELALAFAENAVENGATLRTGWEVASIEPIEGGLCAVSATGERVTARYLVNAAGVHADAVSAMAGGMRYRILPRRGEYMVLDRSEGSMVRHVIFQTPSALGKGVLVTPTVHGNLLIGPTAKDIEDGDDTATTAEGLDTVRSVASVSVPGLRMGQVIRTFSGVRAVLPERGDFLIGADPEIAGLIHVAGISSPGLTAAPAIAVETVEVLKEAGLGLEEKTRFVSVRKKRKAFRDMDDAERKAAIAEDPRYGRIVCRCETVTEAEIIAAIQSPVPARTLDDVKWRTRAGMGRCQSGFCAPHVMEILAREQHTTMDEITKFGGDSWLVYPRKEGGKTHDEG